MAGRVHEGPALHLACSMAGGLACATATAPVDIVKTRYMNQAYSPAGLPLQYSGMLDCALQTVRSEGLAALWKGWLASWARLGPHTCMSLLVFEELRRQARLAPI